METIAAAMRARGVLLRDRSADPGCAGYVRITVGVEQHVTRGLDALRDSLTEIGWTPQDVSAINDESGEREFE